MYVQASLCLCQVCHSQGKISGKRNLFQVREKSGNFVDGQGNLERTWKIREKSGYSKINGYVRQSSENLFILVKRGKDVHSHEKVKSHLPSTLGATLKGTNLLPWGANSFL